jgi:hypothetical protein
VSIGLLLSIIPASNLEQLNETNTMAIAVAIQQRCRAKRRVTEAHFDSRNLIHQPHVDRKMLPYRLC